MLDILGPPTKGWEDIVQPSWVPIYPIKAEWESKSQKTLTRTQLPLTLAWGITIHKSQGLTLEKATIDLGDKDFASGLSFVAISRVKSLKGVAFRSGFPWARIKKDKESPTTKMLSEDNRRRENLGFTLNTYDMDLSNYVFVN